MQKKLVQSSLAMAAAAALGLGGAFIAGPAVADTPVMTEQQAVTAAKQVSTVNAFGFDEKTKTLHLGVENEADAGSAQIQELKKKYGADKVEVITGLKKAEPYAKNDAVGGMGYISDIPSQPGYVGACSTGFSGWDAAGKPIVLTAGHCAEDTGPGELVKLKDAELPSTAPAVTGDHESGGYDPQGIGPLGAWGYNKFGGPVTDPENPDEAADDDIDFAVINLDDSKYNVKPEVTDWTTAKTDDLSGSTIDINSVGEHSPGEIQKSGRTTGLTTGEVAAGELWPFDFQMVGDRWVHGFGVTSPVGGDFSMPGDSGGGVFQGDKAVGVISGGIPDPVTVGGETFMWGWVADLDYSLEQSGASISFDDPNEEPPGDDEAEADASAAADGTDADASAAADGEDADANAAAEGDDANASDSADADAKEADASSAAEGDDAEASADADGAEADASAAADGKDDEADSDADGDEKPEAPKVGDQSVAAGGKITGKAAPNAEVKLTWKTAGANAGSAQAAPAEGTVTVKTDADGNFSAEAPAEAGDYNYTAVATVNGQTSDATQFVVTVEAEEAPAERKLTIEPKEIAASDFVKEDKGVQITAEGFDEGEKVSLEVVAGPENVEGITLEETANADGVVGFSIYGTSASNPEAYLGKYDLEVTGANDTEDEEALTGSFQVVADEDGNGGGNDGDDNGNDDGNGDGGGSDLPRTGAELTGLAAGAGLLLVGGAAVVLTMRRKKNN
ncbi:LPXTG-motif cell wall anchor domain-containing protein [Brevibacterium siliguriense]|uniref:LPXTG-motif cell wall anchor domain-containing protein n=1 Tax=Brevibacterium siliguriense TaxID=1136497 RepID=A0A1H1VHU3_9MICO|nr:S1 family peptidase [Brevibacterium siliguriense]SDS84140.1 LPXTG-motif cell wall anchor domain-containing protein [Brevibacterium siliguriense]